MKKGRKDEAPSVLLEERLSALKSASLKAKAQKGLLRTEK